MQIKHCKKIKIALYILYCEFRLCVTDAQIGADKGIGLSPYPYAVRHNFCTRAETSLRNKFRNFTLRKQNITSCSARHIT